MPKEKFGATILGFGDFDDTTLKWRHLTLFNETASAKHILFDVVNVYGVHDVRERVLRKLHYYGGVLHIHVATIFRLTLQRWSGEKWRTEAA